MKRALVLALTLAACARGGANDALEDAAPSPNASILPAPLATAPQPLADPAATAPRAIGILADDAGRLLLPSDAAPPPAPPVLPRSDLALDADPLGTHEQPGVTLEAEWRMADLPAAPRAPEVNGAGLDAARKLATLRWTIDLSHGGRMRVAFASRAMPLAQGTEIRARTDRYGHVLVWPDGDQYRTLTPGAVRTLLGERRADAIPLLRPQVGAESDGPHRAGLATRRFDVTTGAGKLSLEQAKVPEAGEGGPLLCRLLTELVAVDPSVAPCAEGRMPVRAQYAWPHGGGITFEVVGVQKRTDLPAGTLLTPPPAARFAAGALPPSTTGIFFTRDELASWRSRPLDLGPVTAPGAPGEGILLVNGSDVLRYVLLDGIPIAWVAPGAAHAQYLIGPQRGRYGVQWRTFLGDAVEAPRTVELPARVTFGFAADASAPH